MLRDELEEQRAPGKSGYLATSPLFAGEPFITHKKELNSKKQNK
jgi:hypothetical protein